ncbi:MAG: ABC transporter ATP-binding protein [Terriglobia bacterium]
MTGHDPAIAIENCTRKFKELTAVSQLNLSVAQGEIFGLVGPDGAGKTTTLRMLCGLLEPTEGEIRVGGYDVRHQVLAIKDTIGYMAQRFGMYLDLTVRENLHFYADLFGISLEERQERMTRLLAMTRMEPFEKRRAGQLSGGMKQKLALMCSLLHRPDILILDEPTNGVDPVSRRDFWKILYQLVREGMTVLITTAYMDEAERCNRVGLMAGGRLIRCDSPNGLKTSIRETCFELEATERHRIREVLRSLPGVVSVEPSGATLHAFLDEKVIQPPQIQKILGERGLPSVQFRPITPTLEDIFIAEIQRAER